MWDPEVRHGCWLVYDRPEAKSQPFDYFELAHPMLLSSTQPRHPTVTIRVTVKCFAHRSALRIADGREPAAHVISKYINPWPFRYPNSHLPHASNITTSLHLLAQHTTKHNPAQYQTGKRLLALSSHQLRHGSLLAPLILLR
jgi:hypothetical protein